MVIKYTNKFQGPPKFTQVGIFGLKTNHLATLVQTDVAFSFYARSGTPFIKKIVPCCSATPFRKNYQEVEVQQP
jgi:hypothetical protein